MEALLLDRAHNLGPGLCLRHLPCRGPISPALQPGELVYILQFGL